MTAISSRRQKEIVEITNFSNCNFCFVICLARNAYFCFFIDLVRKTVYINQKIVFHLPHVSIYLFRVILNNVLLKFVIMLHDQWQFSIT